MTALEGAVATSEPHRFVGIGGQDLDLEMLRTIEITLDVDVTRCEIGLSFASGRLKCGLEFLGAASNLQPAAPTTAGRLYRDRVSVLGRESSRLVDRLGRMAGSRNDRNAGTVRQPSSPDLVPHRPGGFGWRSNPGKALCDHRIREVGALRKEPVAGMDRFGPRASGSLQDRLNVQIGVARCDPGKMNLFMRHRNVARVRVDVGEHRHHLNSALATRPRDSHRYLAAVGDEESAEHQLAFVTGPAISLRGPD